jgi:hypothetical protein
MATPREARRVNINSKSGIPVGGVPLPDVNVSIVAPTHIHGGAA